MKKFQKLGNKKQNKTKQTKQNKKQNKTKQKMNKQSQTNLYKNDKTHLKNYFVSLNDSHRCHTGTFANPLHARKVLFTWLGSANYDRRLD